MSLHTYCIADGKPFWSHPEDSPPAAVELAWTFLRDYGRMIFTEGSVVHSHELPERVGAWLGCHPERVPEPAHASILAAFRMCIG